MKLVLLHFHLEQSRLIFSHWSLGQLTGGGVVDAGFCASCVSAGVRSGSGCCCGSDPELTEDGEYGGAGDNNDDADA